ncbi:putative uncharacterized protein SPANXA2-OT1 [Plecturocebus cupreus]
MSWSVGSKNLLRQGVLLCCQGWSRALGLRGSSYLASQSAGIKDRASLLLPGWSAVARSRLTATSASRVQVILLLQPPEKLALHVSPLHPTNFLYF